MISDNELRQISQLAEMQADLEQSIAAKKQELAVLEDDLKYVQSEALPAALAEAGVTEFTLNNGFSIKVKPHYYASISADNKEQAFRWLEDHKLDSVIKNVVKCSFNKGDNQQAKLAMEELSLLGFNPEQEMSVHHMTLKSLVKDLFERGVEFPLDLFGAGVVNKAMIKSGK